MKSPSAVAAQNMPQTQKQAMKKAVLLSWLTIAYLVLDTIVLFLVKGNSQAMQAAWVQDLLAIIPPVAFLVGARVSARRSTKHHPYGFHQSMDIAHLLSAAALLGFGGFLLIQSVMTLVTLERPGIGTFVLFGVPVWQGWVMVAVMAIGLVPPLILGHLKMKPAKQLHNKVLYADAKMNKADWLASAATIIGVTGIGLGIWWADALAAIIISFDILLDGGQHLQAALSSLTDSIPYELDKTDPHPLPAKVNRYFADLSWVRENGCRVREEGQVFHIEMFVVPKDSDDASIDLLIEARAGCMELDWKILDIVVVPVNELPPVLNTELVSSAE